ncbi:MAG: hypothetical protein AAF636_08125 [Pseudomonadota bacterium]
MTVSAKDDIQSPPQLARSILAKRSDTLFSMQTSHNNPNLLFSRLMLARLALDTPDQPVGGVLRCAGL